MESNMDIMRENMDVLPKNDKGKFILHDEMVTMIFGEIGTPKRDEYEHKLNIGIDGCRIRNKRQLLGLTVNKLSKLTGIKRYKILMIESYISDVNKYFIGMDSCRNELLKYLDLTLRTISKRDK